MVDAWDYIDAWWDIYNPMPTDPKDIESGKRAPLESKGYIKYPGGVVQPVTKGNRQTGACQYWVNGLAPVCKLWDPAALKCTFTGDGDKPSGYGVGKCDMLGRRPWCTHYEKSGDYDPNEFACVLPCVERSGKGRQIISENTVSFQPILPEEIQGYNEQEGVGTCDGMGMGRGDKGPFGTLEDAWSEPVVCRFYRPQLMGFGAYQPRPYHGDDVPGLPFDSSRVWIPETTAEMHDQSPADPLSYMDPRLPFGFQVYNSRAMFQICAHWKSNRPAFFSAESFGDNPHDFTIDLDEDPSDMCECEQDACNPYRHVIEGWDETLPPMLQYVWAKYGGIVCNGAKPECPCYSGDWVFCTDANMKDGMRISAEQIMELRFWASNWESKDEYDEFYAKKPGPTQKGYADETTSAIYTFKEWEMIENKDPNLSKMKGVKVDLCQPAPLHMREFIPEQYLLKDVITYPRMDEYTGTNIQGEGVLFPTLLRELDPPPDYVPDIYIVYPYLNKDPWDQEVCSRNEDLTTCVHDFNLMESPPYISVVGYAPKESEIFVFNANIVDNISQVKSFVDQYVRATKVPGSRWQQFIETCEATIAAAEKQGEGMSQGVSNIAGYFHINDVKLELNKINELYVLCKYADYLGSDGDGFTFRKVTVESRYWGALVTQNNAVHNKPEAPADNPFPRMYDTALYLSGNVHSLRGKIQSVIPCYFLYVFTTTGMDYAYYSYVINENEDEINDLQTWAQIGPTGYIWAEIENLQINYLMDFKITEATMKYSVAADDEGNRRVVGMCGNDPDSEIKLEVAYPKEGSSKELLRHTIPPNAVILKAPEPLAFFNSKWTLSIKYTYNTFDTAPGEKVAWPVGLDGGFFALNRYSPSPFAVQHNYGDTTFTIPSLGTARTRGTAKVMAFIEDENQRIQVAASSKLVMQGHNLKCRSVNIFYKYRGDATAYDLEPQSGFFTWTGAPSVNPASSDGRTHSNVAMCGDHLCGGVCPPGYSWYPFNACSYPDFYNVLNGAAQCTMKKTEADAPVKQMGVGAVRYGLPDEYQAWVTPGGNWASACGTAFYYHYSHAPSGSMRFTGKGFKMNKVDKWLYLFRDWALPPFGNEGRGSVERYLVRDFATHIDFSLPKPATGFRFMPHIVDKEDVVNQSLNAFENKDTDTLAGDPFTCFPMMANYVSGDIGESVGEQRYRWDEIVEVVFHGACSYPWPVREMGGVQRYGFKSNAHVWLWPEYWRPIIRNQSSSHGEFKFLQIHAQDYFFDYYKREHRFCPSEGSHNIVFEPPSGAEGDGEGDSKGKAYPSISLAGGEPRFFQIIYEDYNDSFVTWKDESDTGEEGSSGGESGGGEGIYEATCIDPGQGVERGGAADQDPVWIHDYNTVFEQGASQDPSEDRKATIAFDMVGNELIGYYNRGLVMQIPRNRLYYLPIAESGAGDAVESLESDDGTLILKFFSIGSFGNAPIKITVIGDWGVQKGSEEADEVVYSKAGISVKESKEDIEYDDEGNPDWSGGEFVDSVAAGYGSTQSTVTRYTTELELPRRPDRFANNWNHFKVQITSHGSEKLKIHSIDATLGHYVRAEEQIFVWERMYYAGEVSDLDGDNADGTKTNKFRTYHRDRVNAGQYFPFSENLAVTDPELSGEIKLMSKLNMVGCTEIFEEAQELSLSMSNLKEQERDAQKELYEEAYEQDDYDELSYAGIMPPAIKEFLSTVNMALSSASSLEISHYKIPWEDHHHQRALNQSADFWQPGGHFFKWSDSFFKTRCYIFGPVQEVYSTLFVHHLHGGATATLGAGESYAGWGRLWYYEGKLANMRATGQSQLYASTDALTGAKNGVFQESR